MPHPKPPAPTYHHFAVMANAQRQNETLMRLLSAVDAALTIDGEKLSAPVREALVEKSEAVRVAFWPQETE